MTTARFAALLASLVLSTGAAALAWTQTPAQASTARRQASMTTHARGTFDVKITPQTGEDGPVGRMLLEKTFHGDVSGTGAGQMLTIGTEHKESGVYVAVERVTATVAGKAGTFALHHTGVMVRGVPQLSITIVPDSGTGQLAGISGAMAIDIEKDGTHRYDLSYALPPTP